VTEPPLIIPAEPCAIQPATRSSYRLAPKVIGDAKVAFAVPNSCAGDVLATVTRLTPSVRTHLCSPTANCLSSSPKTATSFAKGLIQRVEVVDVVSVISNSHSDALSWPDSPLVHNRLRIMSTAPPFLADEISEPIKKATREHQARVPNGRQVSSITVASKAANRLLRVSR
jgi:hypothetical protein